MKIMKLKYVIASFAFAAALAGCQEAAEYTPSIYITEAQKEPGEDRYDLQCWRESGIFGFRVENCR